MSIEVASSQALHLHKGEDALVVRQMGDQFLLAVADGLSTRDGLASARWVAQWLQNTKSTESIYSLHEDLVEALRLVRDDSFDSETTLSCGILRKGDRKSTLIFDYFAIGDSPIWKVVQSGDAKYPYQRYLIHGGPYPAESARLYSTISLCDRCITGVVCFGSVMLKEGEVLIVCSDGLPEREVLVRDLGSTRSKVLIDWMFSDSAFTDESLSEVLDDYKQRDVFVDDASVIAVRLKASSVNEEVAHNSLPIETPSNLVDGPALCVVGEDEGRRVGSSELRGPGLEDSKMPLPIASTASPKKRTNRKAATPKMGAKRIMQRTTVSKKKLPGKGKGGVERK